ncbi:hypothetical protein SI65_03303 [Aspergillus cristatus]|uniref:Major facilitator superfamily (MFS) profile domain-containing protein n=1 Tax=Aspergillus cristatus TaxID=573508 RepID=A0A1E3BH07_ASPCR|nr:hypothetical protein SI65_03303 [Aspergillus cristatus]
MSGLLTLDTFMEMFPEMDTVSKSLTAAQKADNSNVQGVVVSIYEIGCMMGALGTLWAGDRFGRRKVVFGGAILMTIGAVIQCAAFGLLQFIVGRIITGIGNGFVTATVPMWQSECAKPHRRGAMVMIEGALIVFGLALAYWLEFALYFVSSQVNWHFPIAFQCVFSVTSVAFILELPEWPRWLVKKGRIEESSPAMAEHRE